MERTDRDLAVDRAGRAWAAPRCRWPTWWLRSPTGAITALRTWSSGYTTATRSTRGSTSTTTTRVDARWFEPIVEGMYQAVNGGGTGRIAMVPGLDICGKTGTAQNPHGADNSTFFLLRPAKQPEDSRLGLHRKRGIRRHRRSPDRQPADRALPHRYDPARAAGGIHQKQTDRLPVL